MLTANHRVYGRRRLTRAYDTLSRGATGAQVVQLQQLLGAAGFSPGQVDGSFGADTESAVRQFQTAKGLAADGVVGADTWAVLTGSAPTPTSPPPAAPTRTGGGSGYTESRFVVWHRRVIVGALVVGLVVLVVLLAEKMAGRGLAEQGKKG